VSKGDNGLRVTRAFRSPAAILVAFGFALLGAATPTVAAKPQALEGIDVSHYQPQLDWSKVQHAGVSFVIAKATEGRTFVDPHYATYKKQAEAQRLAFTAYHFARPNKSAGDAVAEADAFLAAAQLNGRDLVPVLDLEDNGGLGVRRLKLWTKDWLDEVQAKLGVKAIIYASPAFWRSKLGNSQWFAANGYRLWIADWTTASAPTVPAGDWGGKGWTFWQYDNCGSVAGIKGCVDRDRYDGTGLAPLRIRNNR